MGFDANSRYGELVTYEHDWAFQEYTKALQLAPDSPLTNFYYGYGWRHLDAKSSVKKATAAQAKAAFQKAVASGDGEIKKQAEEKLKGFK